MSKTPVAVAAYHFFYPWPQTTHTRPGGHCVLNSIARLLSFFLLDFFGFVIINRSTAAKLCFGSFFASLAGELTFTF